MGKLTRDQIVTQGMLLAGKESTALATVVNVSLNAWLRAAYKAWKWPFLMKQATSISLAQGSTSLLIGGGSGGISDDIDAVYDPIFIYTSDYGSRGRVRIRSVEGGEPEEESSILNPATNLGQPIQVKARYLSTLEGKVTLEPYPLPDRAYLLTINYKFLPADISSGSTVPRYPNDRTLIAAAKTFTIEWMKGQDPMDVPHEFLSALSANDFARDGIKAGNNNNIGLDSNVFRK